jgi:hypothetical protein
LCRLTLPHSTRHVRLVPDQGEQGRQWPTEAPLDR